MNLKGFVAALLVSVSLATILWAGCKSDCKDEYTSEVESCHLLYDDPDDADDLRLCIENAKDTYDSCVEECDR